MPHLKTRVKASLSLTVALLGLGAVSTLASDPNTSFIDACKSEVRQHYGEDMDISLVSKRRVPAGIQVKLAARMDQDNTEFVTCWVPHNESTEGRYSQGYNSLAASIRPAPVID